MQVCFLRLKIKNANKKREYSSSHKHGSWKATGVAMPVMGANLMGME